MQRWNLEKQQYEPYSVPKNWFCPIYCNDTDEPINCTCCGKETTFGMAYTSRFIHNHAGIGYPICDKCCSNESKENLEYLRKQEDI